MPDLETTNFLLGLGSVVFLAVDVFLLFVYFGSKTSPALSEIKELIRSWGLPIAFFVTFAGTLTSLYYSEILNQAPCGLCWLQRIFLYPQVILFAIAWKKKEEAIAIYSLVLSALGAAVALYHHALQMGIDISIPCPAVASEANCAVRTFFEFGFLTFPLASFITFAFLIILMLFLREKKNDLV